jgi:hypothetical protein
MKDNHITSLLLQGGLRSREDGAGPGAQTERLGLAGPMRALLVATPHGPSFVMFVA